jgi:Uma2 family endonuclease
VLDALGEYHLRHTYDRGMLEIRSKLYGVAWRDYRKLLDALGDIPLRHTFRQGALEMMSPRKDHDWVKSFLGRLLETVAYELDIDIQCIGSTTLVSEETEQGLQPDEAYYITNEPAMRGKFDFEAGVDPPPDLVIEVDVTNSSLPRMPSFAALGVPEVWRHSQQQVHFYRLKNKSEYEEVEHSVALPFLASADVTRVVARLGSTTERVLLKEFVRELKAQDN